MLAVSRGDGGEIAEDALADAAAVVCGRFFLVGKRRRGGIGDTPRRSRIRKAPNSKHLRRNMLDHYIGRVQRRKFGE